METKGITCKIPRDLHEQITEEMHAQGLTVSQFVESIIREHYTKNKEDPKMSNTRTLAFQVSEELFQRIKAYLAKYEEVYHRRLTQKEFVIGLIEQTLEEADEEFEAAQAKDGVDAAESDNDEPQAVEAEDEADEPAFPDDSSCDDPDTAEDESDYESDDEDDSDSEASDSPDDSELPAD